jgi:hypothetical protein
MLVFWLYATQARSPIARLTLLDLQWIGLGCVSGSADAGLLPESSSGKRLRDGFRVGNLAHV